jgi:predicted alpha/beta-hydrolase family hydrolase
MVVDLTSTSGASTHPTSIRVDEAHSISGLLMLPASARALYLFAHGAGAGMGHPFMAAMASELAQRAIATLRFQFPFMEMGSKRPDSPKLAHATVRAAAAEAGRLTPALPVFAGGRSFGGRMTSQAQATSPLPGVRGLAFFGFPLHAAGRPSDERARHLFDVRLPMLFLQGGRDALANSQLMSSVAERLGSRASLHVFQDADHGFHVTARSGKTDADIRKELADVLVGWMLNVISATGCRVGKIV